MKLCAPLCVVSTYFWRYWIVSSHHPHSILFRQYHKKQQETFSNTEPHPSWPIQDETVHFPVPLMQFPENDVFIDPIALVFVLEIGWIYMACVVGTYNVNVGIGNVWWMCVGVKGATADNRNNFMWTRSQGNHFSIFRWNFPQNEIEMSHRKIVMIGLRFHFWIKL